ncbi:hypothetical protein C2S53_004181 [Perilla frutescens var. hirtella]|uniref:Uncharacterized protein n=1 Tax=Perilla frutescens var. hirtella TaxID=608512 RepID=A0AAD4PCP8_PERFH|nr:hypothetical protein C2S53_004181 [Perilla frutescens var. hirtella]
MEIPEINMLSEFEAGMKCLQNPSFISRFSPFTSFWKWGALIFAIFATFSSIIKRIKLIFIRFRAVKLSSNQTEDVFEFSDDDDDDVSLASSDDEQEAEEDSPTTSFRGQHRVDEDFSVRGSILSFKTQWQNGQLRQRRRRSSGAAAWSEIACGKNVVKLWDSLGFTLDIDEDLFNYDPKSVVSTWDCDREEKSSEFSGGVWGVPAAAATVLLTAERNGKGDGVVLGGYDTRMRSHVPALYAEWRSPAEKVGGVSTTGVSKVYVRDDVSGVVTVGDVRNVRRPLESVRESDGDTWWDADAVIVENEFE